MKLTEHFLIVYYRPIYYTKSMVKTDQILSFWSKITKNTATKHEYYQIFLYLSW